jgi:hypothetical protein
MELMDICTPLVSHSTANAATATATTTKTAYPTNHTPRRKNFMNFDAFFTNTGSSSSEQRPAGGDNDKTSQEIGFLLKLLTFQPSIKWDYS